jgi:hypothetical protein
MEIANGLEPLQDDRIHIELINGRFCLSTRAAQPNTRRASILPLRAVGCGCTKAVRS